MQDDTDELQLPDDSTLAVRIFTVADYATALPDGKLFIGGGGIHNLNLVQIPGPLAIGLYLVLRLNVPFHETSRPHSVRLRLLDEDGHPVGPDPIAEFPNLETGRLPGTRPRDENAVNIILQLTGFPIERAGRAYFYLDIDGVRAASLPLRINRIEPTAGQPG
jgi:hypothetical protein